MTNLHKKMKVQRAYKVSTKGRFKKYVATPKVHIPGDMLTKIGCLIGDFVKVIVADTYIQIVREATPTKEVQSA